MFQCDYVTFAYKLVDAWCQRSPCSMGDFGVETEWHCTPFGAYIHIHDVRERPLDSLDVARKHRHPARAPRSTQDSSFSPPVEATSGQFPICFYIHFAVVDRLPVEQSDIRPSARMAATIVEPPAAQCPPKTWARKRSNGSERWVPHHYSYLPCKPRI